MYKHLSQPDHSVSDLTIRVLQKVGTDKTVLHQIEDFWIKTLNTAFPLGLNEKVRGCHGLVSARQYDGISGTPYLQNKGMRRPRPRGKGRPFRDTPTVDEITNHAKSLLKNKRLYHVLHYLRTLQQPMMRRLRQTITGIKMDYDLRVISAFICGLITSKINPKRKDPEITVIAQYVNHGLSKVLYDNIFVNRQLKWATDNPFHDRKEKHF